MRQLPLFAPSGSRHSERTELDGESEVLLTTFRSLRLMSGVSRRSAAREESQLRSLARESGAISLPRLFIDMGAVASVLREPRSPVSHTTSRARLLAAQQFIKVMGPGLSWDAGKMLAALDALLPSRRNTGWHTAGTLLAGCRGRRRRRGPSLTVADLERLVDAAAETAPGRASRDRALVALHCFTGLRPEEIVSLR